MPRLMSVALTEDAVRDRSNGYTWSRPIEGLS